MDVYVVLRVMVKLFVIMLLGFVLNKGGILDVHTNKKISAMIVNLTAPLLIISAVSSSSGGDRAGVLYVLGAGFLMYLALAAIAYVIVKILRIRPSDRGTIQCMIVFSNNTFMGYPVVQSVLGTEAVFYTSMLHFAFNVFIYTYGVICLSGERYQGSAKDLMKKLMTPGLGLILAALVIYLTDIRLPALAMEIIEMAGSITSPLSMLILGSTLAVYPLRGALTNWRCYGISAIRLLVVPLLTLGFCKMIGLNDFMTGVATLTNAMPVASMVVMFANQYDGNKELVSGGVLVSTTLSVVTIPLISMLL